MMVVMVALGMLVRMMLVIVIARGDQKLSFVPGGGVCDGPRHWAVPSQPGQGRVEKVWAVRLTRTRAEQALLSHDDVAGCSTCKQEKMWAACDQGPNSPHGGPDCRDYHGSHGNL